MSIRGWLAARRLERQPLALRLGHPKIRARFIHEGMVHEIRVDYPPPRVIHVPTVGSLAATRFFPLNMKVSPELLDPRFAQAVFIHHRTVAGMAHYYPESEMIARRVDAEFMKGEP